MPMKCLIVTTHPLDDSLCKQLTRKVVNQLEQYNHEVVVEDLYDVNFDPVFSASERQAYYHETYNSSGVTAQAIRLQTADALILVFPTWWFGFPAMLKGWFDRVWAPGIAFEHADDFGPIKPRLNNLKKVLAVTTLGSPWWVDRLVMRQPVKRVLKMALLGSCANNCTFQFLSLYNSEKLDSKRVRAYERKIEKAITAWAKR